MRILSFLNLSLPKSILCLVILLCVSTVNAQSKKIAPNWKQGDERNVDLRAKMGLTMEGLEFMNTEVNSKSVIKIIAADAQGYTLEYNTIDVGDIDWQSSMLDSLDGMEPVMMFMNGFMTAITEEFTNMPVTYRVERSGEAVSIVDFEGLMLNFEGAIDRAMIKLIDSIEELTGDTEGITYDRSMVSDMLAEKEEAFYQTLLNQVNYLNQAYYEFSYDPTKKISEEAVITEIDAVKYGTLSVKGRVVTEILKDDSQEFRVRIETFYDREDLRKAIEEQGHEIEGEIRIVDRMEMSFDPKTNWIKSVDEYSLMSIGEVEVLMDNSYRFK